MLLENTPIRRKLMTAILLTSGTVLLLTCFGFVAYEVITLRRSMVDGYTTRAKIIASNSTASLAFQNQSDAVEALDVLRGDRRIMAACIYDVQGKLFAKYPADEPSENFPSGPGGSGYRGGHLDIFTPVVQGDRTLGVVYLRSNLSALTDRYQVYAWLSLGIFAGSFLVAFLLSQVLQRQISQPLLALAGTARAVSKDRDFSVRAQKFGDDELGLLTDAFNRMLSEIQAREAALKASSEALFEKTRLLDSVMANMSEGIAVAGLEGKMVYFNKGLEKITGMGISANAPSEWAKEFGVFQEDRKTPFPTQENPLVTATQGIESNGIIQFLRNGANPQGIFVSVNGRPLRDEKGKVVGGLVVVRDITGELKIQEALKASEANYREIFEKINDTIYVHDLETGRILDVNSRVQELIGYSRKEVLAADAGLFITGNPGYSLEDAVGWMKKAAAGEPQLFQWQARHKNGQIKWVEVNLRRTVLAGQDRLLALVRDISERKKLEEVLQSQNFISSVLENLPNMVFVKDAKDLRFVMFNKAGEELLGVSRSDLIGKNDHDFFSRSEADFFTSKDRKTLAEGKLVDIPEETLPTKDKGPRTLHTKKIPVLDSEGKPQYLLGISEDITEQKEQEALKIYTQALETSNREMQDFVFVASHDLQEPLRKIQSFGEFLKDEFKDVLGETGQNYVERMRSAAQRMQTLINDLLALTRVTTKAQPFLPVNLSEVLKGVLSDLETRVAETGAVVEAEALPTIEADATQMRQLFQNLIGNALKFRKPEIKPLVRIHAGPEGRSDKSKCVLRVEDNGIGFDNKYADQIFKVFERLHGRDEYEGTGIGLAVCRKVVERHHGTLKAEGTPGKGCVFTIELPLKQKR